METTNSLRKALLTGVITLFLTSCASVAPPAPDTRTPWDSREKSLTALNTWALNGKVAIITPTEADSVSIQWTQHAKNYTIGLFAPLGAGSLTLRGDDSHITLTSPDGKTHEAKSPEALLETNGGPHLPVSNLRYWVRGLPAPHQPDHTTFDPYGRLTTLTQAGWRIEYLSYTRAYALDLPSRMTLTSPGYKIKVVIHQWE